MADWLFSGLLVRYPEREAHLLRGPDRLDPVHPRARPTACGSTTAAGATHATSCPEPPSTYYWGRIYGCFFDDAAGLAAIDAIGPDQVTFETDYPHADGTWPPQQGSRGEAVHLGLDQGLA